MIISTRIDNMRIASMNKVVRWMSGSLEIPRRDRVRTSHGYDARRFSRYPLGGGYSYYARMDGICMPCDRTASLITVFSVSEDGGVPLALKASSRRKLNRAALISTIAENTLVAAGQKSHHIAV